MISMKVHTLYMWIEPNYNVQTTKPSTCVMYVWTMYKGCQKIWHRIDGMQIIWFGEVKYIHVNVLKWQMVRTCGS